MGQEIVLKLSDLTKTYGKHIAVDKISLEVFKGEIFGFLGPNGAGKTTTIRMITGLLAPDDGTLEIFGKKIKDVEFWQKQEMGFIPDRPYLYEKLTAFEYMQFIALIYNRNENKIKEFLELFGLGKQINNPIESFSHGMRQRLTFAATFLHSPKLVVIDEPMVGLDPIAADLVKSYLRDFCKKGGTVFLSTHTLSVAEEISSRVAIINHGKIQACGTIADLNEKALNSGNLEQLFLQMTTEKVEAFEC